jgi:hypothetical protein
MKFDPMKLSPRMRALLAWSPVLLFVILLCLLESSARALPHG